MLRASARHHDKETPVIRLHHDDPTADWTVPGVYEVDTGLYRIPLPLPHDHLKAVNVYAVRDGDGLVLVDSGWALTQARDLLEQAVKTLHCALGEIGPAASIRPRRDLVPCQRLT